MPLDFVLERVAAIDQLMSDPASLVGSGEATSPASVSQASGASSASDPSSFAAALQQATVDSEGTEGSTSDATALADAYTPTSTSDATALAGAYAPSTYGYVPVAGAAPATVDGATAAEGVGGVGAAGGTTSEEGVGERIVAIAESQAGQTEEPPGSNESPAIAQYRTATAGAIPGAPWCGYFASWVADQAGEPLGGDGEGLGSVAGIWSWAQSTGRAISNGPGVVPKPGDLIVFGDEHVGIVRDVMPDGQIQTVEGNYENKVALNVRSATEATGYVEMS